MNDERFIELVRTMKVMKSNDPLNFSVERFIRLDELTPDQMLQLEREFERKKVAISNMSYYDYFENDYF